jgi:hypothetical protein
VSLPTNVSDAARLSTATNAPMASAVAKDAKLNM